MNNILKIGLLASAVGCAMLAGHAEAAVADHVLRSNAVNYCQAFTPGPANTVRNRVIGAENVGTDQIAVACNFHSVTNGAAGSDPPKLLRMWFSNNRTSGDIQVTCTLLTGWQGQGGAYIVAKTTTAIPAGGTSQRSLGWDESDNPVQPATNLGNLLIGVNCTLPQGAIINDTYLVWSQDNGV